MTTAALLAASARRACRRRGPRGFGGLTARHYSTGQLHQSDPLGQLDVPILRPALSAVQGALLVGVDRAMDLLPVTLGSSTPPISVVDCGSGSTRGIRFAEAWNMGGSPLIKKRKSAWRGDPLALALQDDTRTASLVDLLAEQLPSGLVLVGATAGIRNALTEGVLTEGQLETFRQRLQGRLGERASFNVLSGVEEGRAEWEAVAHELSAHPSPGRPALADCAGMLSGGGMSCQLAIQDAAGGATVSSFENSVLVPGGLVDRAANGLLTAQELFPRLQAHEAAVREKVARLHHGLRGNFALIEWVGFYVAGEMTARDLPMNLGYERPLTRHAILEALEEHLRALRPQREDDTIVPRPVAVSLVYGTVLRELLLEVFDEAATFYCLSGVSWTMGHYLQSRRSACYF